MALGTPTQRYAVSQAAQLGTTTLQPATNTTSGAILVLLAGTSAGSKVISSVSDTKGNTWTVDKTGSNASARGASIASCQNTAALQTTDTITITWSSATSAGCQIWLQEVTGASSQSVFDKSVAGSGTNTTSMSSGTLPTLTQSAEIIFGVFRWQTNGTMTAGTGYTLATTGTLNSAAGMEYQIVASTTGIIVDASNSALQADYTAVAATYREVVSSASASLSPSSSVSPSASASRSLSPSSSVSPSASASASLSPSSSSSASLSPSASVSASLSPSSSASRSLSPSSSSSASLSPSASSSPSLSPSSSESRSLSPSASASASLSPSSSLSASLSPSSSESPSLSPSSSISPSLSPSSSVSASLSPSASVSRSPSPAIVPPEDDIIAFQQETELRIFEPPTIDIQISE